MRISYLWARVLASPGWGLRIHIISRLLKGFSMHNRVWRPLFREPGCEGDETGQRGHRIEEIAKVEVTEKGFGAWHS